MFAQGVRNAFPTRQCRTSAYEPQIPTVFRFDHPSHSAGDHMTFILSTIIAVLAFLVWRSSQKKARQGNVSYRSVAMAGLVVTSVAAAIALLQCFTQIPAGHVGVVDFFGVVSEGTLRAGFSPANPIGHVVKYSIQTQEHKETMQVLSR